MDGASAKWWKVRVRKRKEKERHARHAPSAAENSKALHFSVSIYFLFILFICHTISKHNIDSFSLAAVCVINC